MAIPRFTPQEVLAWEVKENRLSAPSTQGCTHRLKAYAKKFMIKLSIKHAVAPLRMIFWGGLLCVFDITFSQTTNGQGFKFDILNDALGLGRHRQHLVEFARKFRRVCWLSLQGNTRRRAPARPCAPPGLRQTSRPPDCKTAPAPPPRKSIDT
jgi:hypothetical protein